MVVSRTMLLKVTDNPSAGCLKPQVQGLVTIQGLDAIRSSPMSLQDLDDRTVLVRFLVV